jgi:hypothetical protein
MSNRTRRIEKNEKGEQREEISSSICGRIRWFVQSEQERRSANTDKNMREEDKKKETLEDSSIHLDACVHTFLIASFPRKKKEKRKYKFRSRQPRPCPLLQAREGSNDATVLLRCQVFDCGHHQAEGIYKCDFLARHSLQTRLTTSLAPAPLDRRAQISQGPGLLLGSSHNQRRKARCPLPKSDLQRSSTTSLKMQTRL